MTEQDYTEEQLCEGEGRFRVQYQHNPIPTFTWQRTGNTFALRYYNLAAVKLTNGDIEKFVNGKADIMYRNRPDILEYMERCYREKLVMRNEIVSENFKPPKIFIVTWSFAPPDLVITYMEDITRRRRDEEEKKRMQQNLQQIQKMESVGRLAGGIAHDFNNMLTVITGYIELIKLRLPEHDPLLNDITEIEKAAKQSQEITRQLLAFSRQEIIAPVTLDINELIESLSKSLLTLIGEDIDLKFIQGEKLWKIRIDPSQMQQVLMNFLINARDAMPEGGTITIESSNIHFDEDYCRTYPDFLPGDFVMLVISDSGTGIDPETMSRIFEPFFTTKERGKGTGLGLATVYGIVKQNDGFINVYSEPGHGTTFRIYFPRNDNEPVPGKQTTERELARDTGSILLVEDNDLVRGLTTEMLEIIGYRVIAAGSPVEALSFFNDNSFNADLVMTDVVMPQMNGRELENRIREIRPGIKVLYMSGYTANVIVHRGVLADGVHFLQKPFSINELAERVRQALRSG